MLFSESLKKSIKKHRKLFLIFAFAAITVAFTACGTAVNPAKHQIAYPENLPSVSDDTGADFYAGSMDKEQSKYYLTNDYYNMKSDESLHIISNFETYQQTTEYTCGCAVAEMVLNHYGIELYDELKIAEIAETNENSGTSVEGLCRFFDATGLSYDSHAGTDSYFADEKSAADYFIESIDKGEPVLVDWVDFGGHWQAVIGLDTCGTEDTGDDVLILADPYDISDHYQDGYYTFPFGRFFYMWYEGACADKSEPYQQPFVTAHKPQQQ